jgi:mono/diheme cytochrome c family protein
MRNPIRRHGITVLIVFIVLAAGAGIFVYSGIYDIGADDRHTRPVEAMLQILRERSIKVRAAELAVPNLDDPQLVLKGAGQYAAMCTGCHLAPGMADSEIRPGLYPQPPNLAQTRVDPKTAFWVIKHGIKMTGMPAWGVTHSDEEIWNMVAFLQKLPSLSPTQYRAIVASGGDHHDHDHMDMH